jgi:hypothetical protein
MANASASSLCWMPLEIENGPIPKCVVDVETVVASTAKVSFARGPEDKLLASCSSFA